jgi:hypothetical protein
MDKRVGSGLVMFQDEEIKHRLQYRLDKKSSNNQAETLAILKATEKIYEQDAERKQQKNSSHLYRQQDKHTVSAIYEQPEPLSREDKGNPDHSQT